MLHKAISNLHDLSASLSAILGAFKDDDARFRALRIKNNAGKTVLDHASSNPEALRIILASFTDDEARLKLLKETNANGETVVHRATAFGSGFLQTILTPLSPGFAFIALREKVPKGETVLDGIKNRQCRTVAESYKEVPKATEKHLRHKLKAELQDYIDSVKQQKRPEFKFFKDTQARNRQINAALAQDLLEQLNNDTLKTSDIFSNIKQKRKAVQTRLGLESDEKGEAQPITLWGNKVRSSTLKTIIERGKATEHPEKHTDFSRIP